MTYTPGEIKDPELRAKIEAEGDTLTGFGPSTAYSASW